jgi:hypothetical protein
LIGRRVGRKCDPEAVLDALQALAAAGDTDRIHPGRVILEDEAHTVGAVGIVADVDIESQLEHFAEVDARLRHHAAVLELRVRGDYVGLVCRVVGRIAVRYKCHGLR